MSLQKDAFMKGVSAFRAGKVDDALQHFSEAIKHGLTDAAVYDSRAAVLEKLGRYKEALSDAKRVIEIDPNRWQGYSRSARLFTTIGKWGAARTMVNLALQKIKPDDVQRRGELDSLLLRIQESSARVEAQSVKNTYHFGALPVEIASSMFHLALEDNPSRVVILASVCRGWRTTMLQNPSFWDTLYLCSYRPARKAKLWGSRCKGRLRGLHLLGSSDHMMQSLLALQDVPLDHLRELSVTEMSLSMLCSTLPSLTPSVVARLRGIVLHDLQSCARESFLWETDDMQLRSLVVRDVPVDWIAISQHCTHLQEIRWRGEKLLDWRAIHSVLDANPGVETLRVVVTGRGGNALDSQDELPAVLALNHLTSITLGGVWPLETLLKYMSLPSLRSLHIERGLSQQALSNVAAGGGAKYLEELMIDYCAVDATELISFLAVAHNLRLLALPYCYRSHVIAEALAEPFTPPSAKEAGVLCPALTHIDFSHSANLKAGSLVRMVKNRLPNPSQPVATAAITTIIIDDCPLVDSSVLPWLRSKVPSVSCVYMGRKDVKKRGRNGLA